MNYLIYYVVFPMLAKHKKIVWYMITAISLMCMALFCLYFIDAKLRRSIFFYQSKLVEIQNKENSLLHKKNSLAFLHEQRENLSLNVNTAQKKAVELWQQAPDILSTHAHAHNISIENLSIAKQTTDAAFLKKTFSLVLSGSLDKVISFLEAIENISYIILEHIFLYVESDNTTKATCTYAVKKIKNPSTHNKLKG